MSDTPTTEPDPGPEDEQLEDESPEEAAGPDESPSGRTRGRSKAKRRTPPEKASDRLSDPSVSRFELVLDLAADTKLDDEEAVDRFGDAVKETAKERGVHTTGAVILTDRSVDDNGLHLTFEVEAKP